MQSVFLHFHWMLCYIVTIQGPHTAQYHKRPEHDQIHWQWVKLLNCQLIGKQYSQWREMLCSFTWYANNTNTNNIHIWIIPSWLCAMLLCRKRTLMINRVHLTNWKKETHCKEAEKTNRNNEDGRSRRKKWGFFEASPRFTFQFWLRINAIWLIVLRHFGSQ